MSEGHTIVSYVELSIWDLILASCLITINALLSVSFRLGIERTLALATVRMCLQLSAIGFVLKFIFAQTSPLWTLALAMIMILMAGYEVRARQTYKLKGLWGYGLGTVSLMFVAMVLTLFGVGVLIAPEPWYAPRYILPILGMILGNTMTGIALGLEEITRAAKRDRRAIEALIALGADRGKAFAGVRRQALKVGMMPIINAMAASGIVALPGMMTGQILSGVDPVEATKYQLLVMFLIAGATALGVLIAVGGAVHLLTDERHRLRLDRLSG